MRHLIIFRPLPRSAAIVLVLFTLAAGGQDQRVLGSLRQRYQATRDDSARVAILLAMTGEYLDNSTDSAYAICTRARAIARRPEDIGETEGWLGYIEEQRGRIANAIGHYGSGLSIAEELHDQNGISAILNNLAAIYKDQGRTDEALAAHRRSLSIRYAIHDTAGVATSHNNIGLIDHEQGRIPDAMDHFNEALRLYELIGDQEGTSTALHNIAVVYRDQGDLDIALTYFQRALLIDRAMDNNLSAASNEDLIGNVKEAQGHYDEAALHYSTALALHDSVGDERGAGYSQRNLASIGLKRGQPQAALEHAVHSLELFDASGDKRGRASALLSMALALEKLHRAADALVKGEQAMSMAQALGYPLLIRDAAQLLDRLHRASGRWQEALVMHDLYTVMRDSVMNEDARRSTIRQQYKYAYERKEAALQAEQLQRDLLAREHLQKEKNRRNLFLFSGIGVLAVAVGLWSRLRFVRRSRSAIQREKDVSEGLLLNILPEEVAQELKTKGEAEARLVESVTVLFTDFKGFTAMSEQLSPKELVRDIHECFSAFDHITEKHGIEKIKTIGDAYMAAGGLPTPNSTHATDVINAALEMRDFIAEGKARKVAAGLPFFEIRIGVHTGPVVAGIVGVKKFAYDIWGDTVNIASRMESSGEVGQVNISESTYALVNEVREVRDGKEVPTFAFTSRGKVQAKGKGEMEMYFVQNT